jgi:hypothetical protein
MQQFFAEPEISTRASAGDKLRTLARILLFAWTVLVACPIRYWPVIDSCDNTWVSALNYAAAHGLAIGRDVIWTTGPLGYLVFPQDIGHNLAQGLAFQCGTWLVLTAIFADLFFRTELTLRQLTVFSLCFGFSAPLYWFNYMGLENLLLSGMLVLLVVERWRGGIVRYAGALALAGVIPLVKLTGGMIAAGAVAGFLLDRIVRLRSKAWSHAVLAPVIPLLSFGAGCWFLLPSFAAFAGYLKNSVAVVSGYSAAMSVSGDWIELAGAAQTLLWIGLFLYVGTKPDWRKALFFVALLALPLCMSVKHGFVRQDNHIINFFCFGGLSLGLISLAVRMDKRRMATLSLILIAYTVIWLEYMGARIGFYPAIAQASGIESARFALGALPWVNLRAQLKDDAERNHPPDSRIEPEIRAIVGSFPVASLSVVYSGAILDGLNLQIYPVIQRYSAYTPDLDRLNAGWIRNQGPRYLIFDWSAIDGRHPWVETPAMWLEVYRWYDTRLLGARNLLMERRQRPRFQRLELINRARAPFGREVAIPQSRSPLFWTMNCQLSGTGEMRKLLFRIPDVTITVTQAQSPPISYRAIPNVLASPVLGNYLPNSLAGLAAVLNPAVAPNDAIQKFKLGGPGASSYNSTCEIELLRPVL